MNWFFKRLAEPSTWAGIATIVATGSQAVATHDPAAIGATIAGIVAICKRESGGQ